MSLCNPDYPKEIWNTNAYISVLAPDASVLWDSTYNDPNFDCADVPSSPTYRGGNYASKECLYGISQAPDGSLVVSGNSGNGYDDNYMIKLLADNSQRTTKRENLESFYTNFTFYPNPTTGQISIKFSSPTISKNRIKVIDVIGREISDDWIPINSNSYSLYIKDLPGIYFIQLSDTDRNLVQSKIIKIE